MDYDGQYIWIPITKYYPYSESIIVRVDPMTLEVEKMATIDDSIGAIIHDTDNQTLIGMNWDAREFLYWPLNQQKEIIHPEKKAAELQKKVYELRCKVLGTDHASTKFSKEYLEYYTKKAST